MRLARPRSPSSSAVCCSVGKRHAASATPAKPDNAERAGTLFFANGTGLGTRRHGASGNADGWEVCRAVIPWNRRPHHVQPDQRRAAPAAQHHRRDGQAAHGRLQGGLPRACADRCKSAWRSSPQGAAASEKSLVKLESEQDELRRRIAAESDRVERPLESERIASSPS